MVSLDESEVKCLREAISWRVAAFSQGTLQELLRWLSEYIEGPEEVERLRLTWMLDDDVRQDAEKKLIAFLDTAPKVARKRRDFGSRITRNTDWARTSLAHMMGKPHGYWNRTINYLPDIRLLSALLNIACQWLDQLKYICSIEDHSHSSGYNERLNNLEDAIREISFTPIPVSYDTNMEAALRRHEYGGELADLLTQAHGALMRPYDSEKDGELVQRLLTPGDSE